MNDDAPLPELHRTVLDADGVRALVGEIESRGEVVEATAKRAATARAGQRQTPAEVLEALLDGSIVAAQFRYGFEGSVWIDTVVRRPDGFEVVRIEQTL